jgi:hypothetical protein
MPAILFCMILIYSDTNTSRLQYICSFIFKELMGVDFSITDDRKMFSNYVGAKINYSLVQSPDFSFHIPNEKLLFETGVHQQNINCFETNGYEAFFKTSHSDFPFDIFAASFYLLTRYEEYLPYKKDMYRRYAHENSVAFKEGFLQLPLINIWVEDLRESLSEKYSTFNSNYSTFKFVPTYDIDIAYAYQHKGIFRNFGGVLRSLFSFDINGFGERVKVLLRNKKDPFDTYDKLDELHKRHKLQPIYFFLVAKRNTKYDKNILPNKEAVSQLIIKQIKKYTIGIHPSWQSGDAIELLKREKSYLEETCGERITNTRQHYIRFNLPQGYRRLIDAGLENDYSMGYGSINGFRASVASSFYWYDLEREEQTNLRIHPFCYMEANSYYEQKLSATEAFEELMHYYMICKKIGGTLITIWHNHMIGTNKLFKGWGEMYEQFLEKAEE